MRKPYRLRIAQRSVTYWEADVRAESEDDALQIALDDWPDRTSRGIRWIHQAEDDDVSGPIVTGLVPLILDDVAEGEER